ncbi:ATPase AAA [Planctomycetales bacterium 10988]|nr:ATPase AAA [Planctomycetales bacterium 10988]
MAWGPIQGHDKIVAMFRRAIERNRLASTFLFVGPEGIGKSRFAKRFAQALLCTTRSDAELEPCGTCPTCKQVQSGNHPDVTWIQKPEERSFLPVRLFLGDGEQRGKEGLCHEISMKPQSGSRKIAVIEDADYLNAEGANSLLKLLEEPPPRSVLILICTSLDRQLPTIRSRCQVIRFSPLSDDEVAQVLLNQELVENQKDAQSLAENSKGSVTQALAGLDQELTDFSQQLAQAWSDPRFSSVKLAAETLSFVDQAGKESRQRRLRLKTLGEKSIDFFRTVQQTQLGVTANSSWEPTASNMLKNWSGQAEYFAEEAIEVTIEMMQHVDRNVHLTTAIEGWWDQMAKTREKCLQQA